MRDDWQNDPVFPVGEVDLDPPDALRLAANLMEHAVSLLSQDEEQARHFMETAREIVAVIHEDLADTLDSPGKLAGYAEKRRKKQGN